jgi:hypothetical protein
MQMAGLAADLAVQQAKRSTMEQHEATEVYFVVVHTDGVCPYDGKQLTICLSLS